MTEHEAMARALSLALKGWGRVAPNPLVGAVLLRDGAVVGEGHHAEFGGPHAEIAALAACPDPAGTTCVVNLEPCAHYGKTPPCADALIVARVRRVVIALPDPNPDATGGVKALRKAGIEVDVGVGREAAAALNAAFLWSMRRPELPFVALKIATSVDGFLADARGRSQWISGPEAREYVHWLRAGFDAIGVGRQTAEIDDPQLTVRGSLVPRVSPSRVVFARSGSVRPDLQLLRTAHAVPTIIVTDPGTQAGTERTLRGTRAQVVGASGLKASLVKLRTMGVWSLLIEGGALLGGALLEGGLVDRLYWIQAPMLLGSGKAAFGSRPPVALDAATPWVVTERRPLGRDTLLVMDRELCLQGS